MGWSQGTPAYWNGGVGYDAAGNALYDNVFSAAPAAPLSPAQSALYAGDGSGYQVRGGDQLVGSTGQYFNGRQVTPGNGSTYGGLGNYGDPSTWAKSAGEAGITDDDMARHWAAQTGDGAKWSDTGQYLTKAEYDAAAKSYNDRYGAILQDKDANFGWQAKLAMAVMGGAYAAGAGGGEAGSIGASSGEAAGAGEIAGTAGAASANGGIAASAGSGMGLGGAGGSMGQGGDYGMAAQPSEAGGSIGNGAMDANNAAMDAYAQSLNNPAAINDLAGAMPGVSGVSNYDLLKKLGSSLLKSQSSGTGQTAVSAPSGYRSMSSGGGTLGAGFSSAQAPQQAQPQQQQGAYFIPNAAADLKPTASNDNSQNLLRLAQALRQPQY